MRRDRDHCDRGAGRTENCQTNPTGWLRRVQPIVDLAVDDCTTPGRVVQLGVAPNRVDLMTAIDGVAFAEAWTGRVSGSFGGVPVFHIGKAELVRNKRATGRAQDLADVEALE